MRAGLLRKRVQVMRRTESRAADGGVIYTATKLADRWARIKSMEAGEITEANRVQPRTTHEITMRHFAGLTASDYLIYVDPDSGANRRFNIEGVVSVDERRFEHRIACREVR